MSFKDLKKRRGRKGTEQLADEAAKMNKPGGSFDDDRFWKPTRDKSDNGFAVIRFLPAVANEDIPWVRIFSHGFQGPIGKWYIENCPTTLGLKCPACEGNSELWNSGIEANKDIARKRKRRLQYISNVYIVSDPKNPENEGKVFLYKYGVKIFDKLMESMNPEFEDESPVNPFCFWEGANFKLKIRRVKGFVNYDKSEFEAASQLLNADEEALEALYKTQHSLQQFIGTTEFKKYEVLKDRRADVLNENDEKKTSTRSSAADHVEEDVDDDEVSEPVVTTVAADSDEEISDAKSYFEGLADED